MGKNTGAKSSKYPCHNCGKVGHWKADCPEAKESKGSSDQVKKDDPGFEITKKKKPKKPKNVKFANYTAQEDADKYFDDCNYSSFLNNAFWNHFVVNSLW